MSERTEVKTAEMTGTVLNWATFCAVYAGMEPMIYEIGPGTHQIHPSVKPISFPSTTGISYRDAYDLEMHWNPSGNWDHGGPLVDRFEIEILRCRKNKQVRARVRGRVNAVSHGETALIAICRAIVSYKIGDTVMVPSQLLGGAS